MSEITFDPQLPDPPPVVIVDFHTWLAGSSLRYQRRPCSCGCQDKPTSQEEFIFENAS